ncbi:MAG: Zn-ribbon containing protein [Candidatus Pacearchaeota archaeon]|jgi:predicted  nucleic acid-binding Zn-ribbon protein
MPHQCVHCSKVYPNASKELIEGCECGSHFFFFIRDEIANKLKENPVEIEFKQADKVEIEKEVREIIGIEDEDAPVILDLESVKVLGPGKFEIDVVNLFNRNKPLIYKLEEGKYIIDLASAFKAELGEA